MRVGDLGSTTAGRLWINTVLLPRLAKEAKEGDKILFIGNETNWDYKSLFFNPSCLCDWTTMDIAERFNPDIVGDISNCPQIPDNTYDLLILIGIYEFVNNKPAMFSEINRIIKPTGKAELSLPGPAAYESPNNHIWPKDVFEAIKPLRIEEMYITGETDEKPCSSIHIIARKTHPMRIDKTE